MFKLMFKKIQLKLKLQKKKIQCPKHQATRSSGPTLIARDWANLPEDILDEISKIICHVDLPSFAAVCKSWRSMYLNRLCDLPRNVPFGVPILLLNASESDSNSCKFIRMSGELASDEIFLPEAANKWVCGSSWGWLVLVDTNGVDISLLNPLTRRVIQLPSVDTFTLRLIGYGNPDVPLKGLCYIHKAILSTNTAISKEDCVIMAIVGLLKKLSYCRIGDKKWTNVENCLPDLCEVIYHQGKFYACTQMCVLMSCDITNPNSTKKVANGIFKHSHVTGMKFLVLASGSLLLVARTDANSFDVRSLKKLDSSSIQKPSSPSLPISNEVEIQHEWVKIDSIGDHLLFIGRNSSFSLPARMYGGRANCIYFTNDPVDTLVGEPHVGVFNITKNYTCFYNANIQGKLYFPSFWVTPTPW